VVDRLETSFSLKLWLPHADLVRLSSSEGSCGLPKALLRAGIATALAPVVTGATALVTPDFCVNKEICSYGSITCAVNRVYEHEMNETTVTVNRHRCETVCDCLTLDLSPSPPVARPLLLPLERDPFGISEADNDTQSWGLLDL